MSEFQRIRSFGDIYGSNPGIYFDVPVRVTNPGGGLIYLGNAGGGPYSFLQYNPQGFIIDTGGKILHDRYGDFVPRKRFTSSGVYHNKVTWNAPLLPDYRVYRNDDDSYVLRVEILGNRPRVAIGGIPVAMFDDPGSASFAENQIMMPQLPGDERSTLCLEAFNYFNDVFPETLPIGEFLQGFSQLKDLLPKIEKSITKTISGGYLNEKFGWENLLTDLEALGGLFAHTMERMDYLRRTYGKPQRMGFSRPNCWEPDSLEPFSQVHRVYPPDNATGARVSLQNYRCDFRATCKIYQTLDYIDGFTGFLRVMTGELGLNNPVKTIWNMLPMSFVVDWFFNVSSQLDRLTRLNPAEGWNVFDVTHSLTYTAEYLVQPAGYDEVTYYWVFDSDATGSATRHQYMRYLGLSIDLDALEPDNLSPNELALFLALLHQLG
jgi:hypothetical protein